MLLFERKRSWHAVTEELKDLRKQKTLHPITNNKS